MPRGKKKGKSQPRGPGGRFVKGSSTRALTTRKVGGLTYVVPSAPPTTVIAAPASRALARRGGGGGGGRLRRRFGMGDNAFRPRGDLLESFMNRSQLGPYAAFWGWLEVKAEAEAATAKPAEAGKEPELPLLFKIPKGGRLGRTLVAGLAGSAIADYADNEHVDKMAATLLTIGWYKFGRRKGENIDEAIAQKEVSGEVSGDISDAEFRDYRE